MYRIRAWWHVEEVQSSVRGSRAEQHYVVGKQKLSSDKNVEKSKKWPLIIASLTPDNFAPKHIDELAYILMTNCAFVAEFTNLFGSKILWQCRLCCDFCPSGSALLLKNYLGCFCNNAIFDCAAVSWRRI